jgi:hypothetical protein
MTSPTPTTTTTHRPAPQGTDPSDLLSLTLRFATSAYLASQQHLHQDQAGNPKPEAALHAIAKPLRKTLTTPPRLIVGQALDRIAA